MTITEIALYVDGSMGRTAVKRNPHVNHDHVLQQVGEYLAQVDGLTSDQHSYLGAHQPMQPQDNWLNAFGTMRDIIGRF